jgi:hypothetical protein
MNKRYDVVLSWTATAILIAGSAVNGLGHYPAGPLMLSLGGVLWFGVAMMRRDWPLMITNFIMSFIAVAMVIYNLAGQ